MQAPGVYFIDLFSPVTLDTSTRILIGLTLYYKDDGYIAELCDVELAFFHPNRKFKMYIECPEGIVYLGIISKKLLRGYCILLGNSMYGNVDAALLWLRLLDKYLVNECNLKSIKAES